MSLNVVEGGPAVAKRRRVKQGTVPAKARSSITMYIKQNYCAVILMLTAALVVSGCASQSVYRSPAAPTVQGFYHSAKKGETLWRISKMYGTGLEDIVRVNSIYDVTRIEEGQLILIPGTRREPKLIPAPAAATTGQYDPDEFIWPLKGKIVSTFGQTSNNMVNKGINIKPYASPDISASRPGKVVFCSNDFSSYGKTVILDHGDGFLTVYSRNSEVFVRAGEIVPQGRNIARAGSIGRDKSQYLHFEIRKGHKTENPLFYLP